MFGKLADNIGHLGKSLFLDFIVRYVYGTQNMNNISGVVDEIVSQVTSDEKTTCFIGVHYYSGRRMFWGFLYQGGSYGTIFISDYNNRLIKVYIQNGEYNIVTE